MCDIIDLEEALTKTGPELFKELYRVYPCADVEDYFKAGQWRNDVLKTDLVLFESHRREAGAPDVPDLDQIKFPSLPAQTIQAAPQLRLTSTGGQQPSQVTAGSGPVVEIRLIALFVAKWKLDPVSAKTALAKLNPTRRRYVIQHFKATTTGVEAVKELEAYIAECEKHGSWDAGAPAGPAASAGATAPASSAATTALPATSGLKAPMLRSQIRPQISAGGAASTPTPAGTTTPLAPVTAGAKRPVSASTVSPPGWAQNKRPTLGSPAAAGSIRPGTSGESPAKGGGKSGPSLVRPPIRPGGTGAGAGAGGKPGSGKLITGLLSGF